MNPDGAHCRSCGRVHLFRAPNVLELMPARPVAAVRTTDPIITAATERYLRLFNEQWTTQPESRPWGDLSSMTDRTRRRYKAMAAIIDETLPPHGGRFLDISAGGAALSLPLVERFDLSVLSDISVGTVAALGGEGRAFVVRADYLQSPFAAGSFDYILCTDTLIYGRAHDERLLRNIWRALAPGGKAVISLHNARHRVPLRKPFVLSYTKKHALQLFGSLTPTPAVELVKYHQEITRRAPLWEALRVLLPATRFFAEATKQ